MYDFLHNPEESKCISACSSFLSNDSGLFLFSGLLMSSLYLTTPWSELLLKVTLNLILFYNKEVSDPGIKIP